MEIQDHSNKITRGVGFSKRRYPIFKKVDNSSEFGIKIKKPKLSGNDIIITDFSTEIAENDKTYNFTYVIVSGYRGERMLKTSDVTKVADSKVFNVINLNQSM